MLAVALGIRNSRAVDLSTTDDDLDPFTAGLWVGGAGNVKVDMRGGQTVTFNAVAAGTLLPIAAVKVYKIGTSATNIVALW